MTRAAARVSRSAVLAAAVVSVAACGAARSPRSAGEPARYTQTGIASWYGPGFHGKPTASGETYDQNALTAAHRTLPLGTTVRVTNLGNGRRVEVRINDRGPFVGDRIIDLSHAAARAIDMVGPGTARVRVDVVDTPVPIDRVDAPVRYTLQLGSFTQRANADALRDRAASLGNPVIVTVRIGGTTYYRVCLGLFATRDAAEPEAARVRRAGFDVVVVER